MILSWIPALQEFHSLRAWVLRSRQTGPPFTVSMTGITDGYCGDVDHRLAPPGPQNSKGKIQMKRKIAWALLVISGIGWPLTQLTIAKEEPPIILALSWLAIILTALDGVWITEDRED
jgi:hypothetical protein